MIKRFLKNVASVLMLVSFAAVAQAATLPKAEVSKLPALTLSAGNYMVWPNGSTEIDRPLQIVMNFKTMETVEEARPNGYLMHKCDFYLTFTGIKEAFYAKDCYLAGNYGSFGWVVIPADDVKIEEGVEYPVVAGYDANITYKQICEDVKNFTAAIHVAPAVLEANPDFKVKLALKMTNPNDENDVITIGEPAVYTVADLKPNFSIAIPDAGDVKVNGNAPTYDEKDAIKKIIQEFCANTGVAAVETGIAAEDNADEIAAAKAKLAEMGVDAGDANLAVPSVAVTLAEIKVEEGDVKRMVFDVTPAVAVGENSVKISEFSSSVTFRLPIPADWYGNTKVYHKDVLLEGTYAIKGEGANKYIEVASKNFSAFSVEVIASAARIGEVAYDTLAEAVASARSGDEIIVSSDITLAEMVEIPAGKTLTIDLNGKAIAMEESILTTAYALNNMGTLTLKDSVGTGSVSARGIYNGYNANGDPVTSAKIVVESGTYNAKGTNGGAAVFNYGEAEIKGGTFTSVGSYAVNTREGSKLTVEEGATITGGMYLSFASVVINGGKISGSRSDCHVVYSWSSDVTINGGVFYNYNSGNATLMAAGTTKMTINGGVIGIKDGRAERGWTSYLMDTENTAALIVNDGEFNGGSRIKAGASMMIKGGFFNDVYGSNYAVNGVVTISGGAYIDANSKAFAKVAGRIAEDFLAVDVDNVIVVAKLPTATVTSIPDAELKAAPNLTYSLKFKADDVSLVQMLCFTNWYADFELTVNKDVTFNAVDEAADGYLSGSYDNWLQGAWISMPTTNVTIKAGEPLRIMDYGAELLGKRGLKMTYGEVATFVKTFKCGVVLRDAFLAANPGFKIGLSLKMYNPDNEAESFTIGSDYEFEVPSDDHHVTVEDIYGKIVNCETMQAVVKSIAASGEAMNGGEVVLLKDMEIAEDITMTGTRNLFVSLSEGTKLALAENKKFIVSNMNVAFVGSGTLDGFTAANVELDDASVLTLPASAENLALDFEEAGKYVTRNADNTWSVANKFELQIQMDGEEPAIGFLKDSRRTYVIEASSDLVDWSAVDYVETTGDSEIAVPLKWLAPASGQFFRVKATTK